MPSIPLLSTSLSLIDFQQGIKGLQFQTFVQVFSIFSNLFQFRDFVNAIIFFVPVPGGVATALEFTAFHVSIVPVFPNGERKCFRVYADGDSGGQVQGNLLPAQRPPLQIQESGEWDF